MGTAFSGVVKLLSELTEQTTASDTDVTLIGTTSPKKITFANLKKALGINSISTTISNLSDRINEFPKTIYWKGQFAADTTMFSFPAEIVCRKYANNTCDIHISCKCETNAVSGRTVNIFSYPVLLQACKANSVNFRDEQTHVMQYSASDINIPTYSDYWGRTGLSFQKASGNLLLFSRAYSDALTHGGWGSEATALYQVGNYYAIDIWGATYA